MAMIAESYDVYFGDLCIGTLDIDERGLHRYRMHRGETECVFERLPLDRYLLEDHPDFAAPSFLAGRIARMKLFSFYDYTFHADGMRLVRSFCASEEK